MTENPLTLARAATIILAMVYALHPDVVVRREHFGCIACDASAAQYFQFNADAYAILKRLIEPKDVSDLLRDLQLEGLKCEEPEVLTFLEDLSSKRLLTNSVPEAKATCIENERSCFDALTAPVTCTVYLTERCSKECRHCVVRSSPRVSRANDMTPEEWRPILKELKEWGVFTLVFTGGEPLMAANAIETLELANLLGFNLTLLTDFDGMTPRLAERLRSIRLLNQVQTSLDGGTQETHDFVRGAGSFKRTLRRLEIFRDSGLLFTIATSVNKLNLRELDQIIEIYHRYKVRYLYLNPVAPYGRAREQMAEILLDEEELRALAYRYYWAVTEEGVHSGNAFWQTLTEAEVLDRNFHPFKDALGNMSIGTSVISISSQGDVYLDSKMKSEGLLCLGNAKRMSVRDMWNDRRLGPLRARFDGGKGAFIPHQEVVRLQPNPERISP